MTLVAQQQGWRGLPSFVLAEAGVTRDAEGLVAIPYRLADGGLYAERVVAPGGRRWWRPGDGRQVIPFGLDRLERLGFRRYRALLICEGESDTLAARAALAGCGLDVLGVPGAGTWRPEWAIHASGYAAVYVAGDGDEAGRMLDAAVFRDVPGAMPLRLSDGADVRALLQGDDGRGVVLDLMRAADGLQAIGAAFTEATCWAEFVGLLGVAEPVEALPRAA